MQFSKLQRLDINRSANQEFRAITEFARSKKPQLKGAAMSSQEAFRDEVNKLSDMAASIRYLVQAGQKVDRNHPLVVEYNEILERILENGFSWGLDFEDELPDDLISDKYIELIQKKIAESKKWTVGKKIQYRRFFK